MEKFYGELIMFIITSVQKGFLSSEMAQITDLKQR